MRRLHKLKQKSCLVEQLECRQLLSTYYISAHGSDSASGKSTKQAWRSIDRVNAQVLKPGDKVLFEGGKTFNGGIYLPSKEAGTASKPIIFSNYGNGRATIKSGNKAGIDIAQGAGVAITNLNFVGSGMKSNDTPGIYLHADWNNMKLSSFHVRNVEVKNYGRTGIYIKTSGKNSSLANVKIERASLHDNLWGGLKATGSKDNANKNWVVQYVKAYNSPGDGTTYHVTGSGIFISHAENLVVQKSIAFNNGERGAAPVGMWVSSSKNVVFQYNESYNNRTMTGTDGGGFDFDWDVYNSTMQYNYSHGNDGPGYLLCPASHGGGGNIIRYNISENDGRKNGRSGIQLFGEVVDAQIYNNTVYMSPSGKGDNAAFWAHDDGSNLPKNVLVRNNIFYAAGGTKVVKANGATAKKGSIKFTGNNYYAGGKELQIQWGSKKFKDLASWRKATGQEKTRTRITGYTGNPKLLNPGKGGTIGNADKLKNLSAYKLSHKSKLINRGMAIPSFLASTVKDFFGGHLPKGGRYDIGANEVK